MSACFYDIGGAMVGLDAHTYVTVGPMYAPVPVLFTPHVALADFNHPTSGGGKRLPTVVAEGRKMIQRGFKVTFVPHFPITAMPPHIMEAVEMASIIWSSFSKAYLGMSSVTGEGAPLATCAAASVGVNGNCGPGVGAVYNPSSVITSPTTADFASAGAAFVTDAVLGKVVKLSFPLSFPFKKWAKPAIEKTVRDLVESALS